MKTWLRLAAVVSLCAAPAWAVDWKARRPQGFVTDFAEVVDAPTTAQLNDYCAKVERATGTKIALVTLTSLEGEPLEDVAHTIFQSWVESPGASQSAAAASQKHQRVMVIVTVSDRHDWVGMAGLNPEMAARLSNRILRETRVALRRKEYGEAFKAAAETIGEASARSERVALSAHMNRHIRWSPTDAIPWAMVGGAVVVFAILMWTGNPAGYGGFSGRGLIPGLFGRSSMCRSTWGSRGSGGFGGFDSGDSSGGFGGGFCRDW
jgi:uncharacterized protein